MPESRWWQECVFYQIYPRSFADSNGDGIGDLPGIVAKLDYLRDLGIGAIWLSPHYPSPQVDCGYDVSDYCDVAPEYGTLDDLKRLIDQAGRRGIRVVTDLVLNHTSTEHAWFRESRANRDNPKRDWYVWKDGRNGGPPNNWLSDFGGSAWEYDAATDQYYYHFFFKEQADLNWRNPAVKQAMWDVVRFWLDLGVAGFRLDAVVTLYENPAFPDHRADIHERDLPLVTASSKEDHRWLFEQRAIALEHQWNQPGLHETLRELRAVVDAYDDRVLIGETSDVEYLGNGADELHAVFGSLWTDAPKEFHAAQRERLAAIPPGAGSINALGSHDGPRAYPSGDRARDEADARRNAALTMTASGTPLVYYGNEIGMASVILSDIRQFRDPLGVFLYQAELRDGTTHVDALRTAVRGTRDQSRSPMQWSNAPNAGFSPASVEPWLPVNPDYAFGVNAEDQAGDPASRLSFFRRLIRARITTPALRRGDYRPLGEATEEYIAVFRHSPRDRQTCLVAISLIDMPLRLRLDLPGRRLRTVLASVSRRRAVEEPTGFQLEPREVYIAEVQPPIEAGERDSTG